MVKMTIKVKRKWTLWLSLFIVSLILIGLCGSVIKYHRDLMSIPSHHLIGNRPSGVGTLKESGFPFSFLVIGDTQNTATAGTLIQSALKTLDSSFMIILGDFVKKADIWNHRFFLTRMTTEMKLPFPVFLVPGNHDIDYKGSIKNRERRVTQEVYESVYGERNFDFCFNGCLFILCGIDWKEPPSYLHYLRKTLYQKGKGKRYIFLFVHFPPKGLAEYIEGLLPNEEEFFSLLETYRVTTCFFGDHHGYWRGQMKGVSLLISGGGGGRLTRHQWGRFHHILKVTVDQDKISEDMITIRKQIGLENRFERWIFTTLFPTIQNSVWVLYLIFVILLTGSGYSLLNLTRALRHS